MCGIWALFSKTEQTIEEQKKIFEYFNKIKNRGPDVSNLLQLKLLEQISIFLGFHRLSIIDTSPKGIQPFIKYIEKDNRTIYTLCNGEIYNYKELIEENDFDKNLLDESDCKVINEVYLKYGIKNTCLKLLGEYAFMILDVKEENITLHLGRDPLGVRPLYISYDDEKLNISSELKGIINTDPANRKNYSVNQVESGCYTSIDLINLDFKTFQPNWVKYYDVNRIKTEYTENDLEKCKLLIRETFTKCVIDRLNADVPIGFLLSGGLDSSLVCGIAANYLKNFNIKIRTFSCGLETGSTDEPFARMVSEHINSNHTHIVFTEKEFIDAIPTIVYNIETYDITTVRASVGQYLISRWIKNNTNIKVLLIGDGSDELTKGYKYNHKAPNAEVAQEDTLRLLKTDKEQIEVLLVMD